MKPKTNWRAACALILAVPLLAACAGEWDSAAVRNMPLKGNDFTKALHKEYLALAEHEQGEVDWRSVSFYNARARMSGNGEQVYPTKLDERNIPADKAQELSEARNKLMNAYYGGGPAKAAAQMARAQAMFDCWMEQQEEGHQAADIAKCRIGYTAAMDALWKVVNPPVAAAAPAPKPAAPAPAAAPGPTVEKFAVYFPHNSAKLDREARIAVIKAAAYAGGKNITAVVISGHADRSGNAAFNRGLAERRAMAVEKLMKDIGVKPRITVQAFGEDEPAVQTADDAKEPRNRRVEIRIQ